MSTKTIADLRANLFAQLEAVSDTSKPIDLDRMRLQLQVAQTIINTAKVEVEFAAVLKGSMELPFIEAQAKERSALPPAPTPVADTSVTPMERTAQVLAGGPAPSHPWRSSVHRLRG